MASQAVSPTAVSAPPREGTGLAGAVCLVRDGWADGLQDSPRVGGDGRVSFEGGGSSEAARRGMGRANLGSDAVLWDGEIQVDAGTAARFQAGTETGRPRVLAGGALR